MRIFPLQEKDGDMECWSEKQERGGGIQKKTQREKIRRTQILVADHLKDHSEKIISTLTNAYKHSQEEKNEKE